MILQALYEYYQRKAADPESGIAPEGFEWKEIPFLVVLDRNGNFVTLEDTRSGEEKRAKRILVPQGIKRSVGVRANLLWDNVEYALGANPRDRNDVDVRFRAFQALLAADLPPREQDGRVAALLRFLENNPSDQITASPTVNDVWAECLQKNANVTFRIDGDIHATLCEAFHGAISRSRAVSREGSICLVSGDSGPIEPTHPSLKGVRGAQSSGASLVSFNSDAYSSFGKHQNFNAPVSKKAVFAYTTALNELLGRDSRNKVQVGDATAVFWSERPSDFEDEFASFFGMPPKDDPNRDADAVRALYRSLDSGALDTSSQTRFFVLGLAPNAARISVRFWRSGTVREFATRLRQHFDDLEIIRSPKDVGRYSLFWLLVEMASEGKIDNVPPTLAGDIARAVLEGAPYPATLLQQTIRRIRAEQKITRIRAGILKAYLNRFHRSYPANQKEITVSLDPDNKNPGYRLGRLFAILEKIQEDASPGLNATIRDRYYGAASANPVTVFPQLLKLKNHHLKKLENPSFVKAHEKRLQEIFSGLSPEMPTHLRVEDQARFAIGYYHQRQALFTKSATPNDETPSPEAKH